MAQPTQAQPDQPSPAQPTEAERVTALQAGAAADRATYKATRTRTAAVGNLTRGQQGGQR